MRERDIEQRIVSQVKAMGGWAVKLTSPMNNGMPDRMTLFPGGQCVFIEVKRPGEMPTPIQLAVHRRLKSLGFDVLVVDGQSRPLIFTGTERME